MTQERRGPAAAADQRAYTASGRGKRLGFRVALWGVCGFALVSIVAVAVEAQTAYLQSLVFTRLAHELTFNIGSGPSDEIRFPTGGPQDKRLGYSQLASYIGALNARNFSVARQASWSPALARFAADHGYAVYREKEDAGLTLSDRTGAPFYRARYPERTYQDFQSVPPLVVSTLTFIEDRSLLDPRVPRKNPAVNWQRLALATAAQAAGKLDPDLRQGGASTLATQIEKFRHYPDGRTRGIDDKFHQMMAAATRSYLDGPETLGVQQRIVSTFLNSTPLSSRPGYGEIIGVGDGLWAWYGSDLAEANRLLAETGTAPSARKAEIYKQVLSLLLAQRRPSYYLMDGRKSLDALTNNYLRLLGDAGIIDGALRDAALHAQLNFLPDPPSPAPVSFVDRKAAAAVRMELLRLLGTPSLYDLDRLDVAASTTFDAAAQQRVSDVLPRLADREQVKSLGMVGLNLLGTEDPSRVNYSVVVYERGTDRNFVRVHADSLDQPFDLNSGAKLILGSTAKLRTLITYLGIMNRLHDEYENMPSRQLLTESAKADDALTRWATAYLANAADRSLQPMLEAAMQRRYSASPAESFFTGGGVHVFENFEKSENRQVPTVEDALVHSINLAFIRVMRDIRSYYMAEGARGAPTAAEAKSDARQAYLKRFADQEGRTYLNHFYDDLRARKPDEMLSYLAARAGRTPNRLAIVYRSLRPEGSVGDLRSFLGKELPKVSLNDRAVESLYANSGPDRYSLADRAYLARVHPLQLWLAAYLQDHAGAPRAEILKASDDERQEAYSWLFKTRSVRKQDVRIRIVSEQDAFNQILKDWRNQGYPFEYLVPSLATAIGSSGDRPDALAELMGIILNDGVELPTVEIEQLHFAADTPYETRMALTPTAPRRVFAPEIARTVRRVLMNVVSEGTGTRFRGAYVTPDGKPLVVGGKTGTGDNRFKSYGARQHLVEARVVDRTATFVFFIGDRFYGTITGYVAGPEAGKYHFTSALAVQLLKSLTPQLQPLINTPQTADQLAASPSAPVPEITFVSGVGVSNAVSGVSNAVSSVSKAVH